MGLGSRKPSGPAAYTSRKQAGHKSASDQGLPKFQKALAMQEPSTQVSTPSLQLFPRIGEAHEPMLVQAFCPEPPVEGLDEGVVCRLSGP